MDRASAHEQLLAALADYANNRPGVYRQLQKIAKYVDGLAGADPEWIELSAIEVAGATGDRRLIPVLGQLIRSRFAAQATRLAAPTPGWEQMSDTQKSHAAVAGATELFELLDEQIAAATSLGQLAHTDAVGHLVAAASHPECHQALYGAVRKALSQLADAGVLGAEAALRKLESA